MRQVLDQLDCKILQLAIRTPGSSIDELCECILVKQPTCYKHVHALGEHRFLNLQEGGHDYKVYATRRAKRYLAQKSKKVMNIKESIKQPV